MSYLISSIMKFHFGCFFLIAADTSDSVGFFELTCTDCWVVAFGVPPVDEYFSFTLTDGIALFLLLSC